MSDLHAIFEKATELARSIEQITPDAWEAPRARVKALKLRLSSFLAQAEQAESMGSMSVAQRVRSDAKRAAEMGLAEIQQLHDRAVAARAREDEQRAAIQRDRRVALFAPARIRDQALSDAIFAAKGRLDDIWPSLSAGDEDAFAARLAGLEDVARTLATAVSVSKRESRSRCAAADAAAAVSSLQQQKAA